MKLHAKPNLLNDYHLLAYDELDSTNEEAKRLAIGGGSHGAIIWAKKQTQGKGRMGRVWESAEGNLFCSILLCPGTDDKFITQLSFVAAVAAIQTLKSILPEETEIKCKWPNDVLLDDKKIAGILLESFEHKDKNTEQKHRWVVVGVGINVDSFPTETNIPATCLKSAGVEIISAKIVLSRFIHHFITCYDIWAKRGFSPIRRAWIEDAYKIGKNIEVKLPKAKYSGVFEGIDIDGALLIRKSDGTRISLPAGDLE
jgi:BirA family transcriptional regulator, biotin operon repressor / biotin---[acetyl-CoA-carboxylase] ligase